MKRWIFLTATMAAAAVFSIGLMQGCRHIASPTFPATSTPLPGSPTNTPTNTPVITSTPTGTFTKTNTFTPSPTGQATATNTPTATVTGTPTNSATPTVTSTPTGTPTACSPVVQATYAFDSGTECWKFDGSGAMAGLETVLQSATTVHSGAGAWEGIVNYSGPATQEEVSVSFPCGTFENLTSATVTMYVYVTAAVNGQMFCNFGNSPTNCYSGYQNPGYNSDGTTGPGNSVYPMTANSWTTMYFKPYFAASDGQYVSKFGVNITNITSPVTIYVDDVSITTSTVPTATPTSTPTPVATWNFEDNTADGWVAAGGNVAGVVMSILSPGQTGGASDYCVNLNAPFTGTGQAAGIQQGFTTPLNLTGGGISAYVWIDAGTVTGGFPGGQIFPQDNTGVTSYSYYQNLTQGAWTYLNLTAANFGSVNAAAITQITVQAAVGGSGTATTGNVKIDDIVAY